MPLHYMRSAGPRGTLDISFTQENTQNITVSMFLGLLPGFFFLCPRFWPRLVPDNGLEWPVRQDIVPLQSLTPGTWGITLGSGLLALQLHGTVVL